VQVKGVHLAVERGAVCITGTVQILVAIAPAERLHSAHPEMIGVGTQDVNGLTKSQFDPESIAVEHEDLEGREGEVGAEEKDRAAQGMTYDHETHDATGRTPDQIQTTVAQSYVVFTVDGAGRGSECGIVVREIFEADFFVVDPRPAASAVRGRRCRKVSDGVSFGPSYELMPIGEELSDEPTAGIVGIRHEQNLAIQAVGDREKQCRQLIEQGSGIAV
jgi:hypothetical protein